MTMERKEAKGFYDGEKYTKVEEGDMDPSENQIITLTCFPTFSGTQPLKDFLNKRARIVQPSTRRHASGLDSLGAQRALLELQRPPGS